MQYRVKGAVLRYNGHRYGEGDVVEIADHHAGPLLDVGRLEHLAGIAASAAADAATAELVAQVALSRAAKAVAVVGEDVGVPDLKAELAADRELLGNIYDVVCQVEGVPGHLMLLDAVKWVAAELANVRAELGAAMALVNARQVAPPEPPAEAEPEPKAVPEAKPDADPAPEPAAEPDPEPAKPEAKKRGK